MLKEQGEEKSCIKIAVGYFFAFMELAEAKIVNLSGLLEKFSLEILSEGENFSSLYAKAVKSLTAFIGDTNSTPLTDFDTVVCDWFINLRVQGFTLKTALAYLKVISGLYKRVSKSSLVPATDIFKFIRSSIREHGERLWSSGIQPADFNRFRESVIAESAREDSDSVGADIMLISLFYGCVPVAEAAAWKKNDLPAYATEAEHVVNMVLANAARSYLFPLRQSTLTSGQLKNEANTLVLNWFLSRNIKTFGDADSTLLAYWGYAALLAGMSPHEVAASLSCIPQGLLFLTLCRDVRSNQAERSVVNASAVKMFAPTPKRWYAMHLRTRVTIDDLKTRFSDEKGLKMPEIFYPSQEIARRIGKKIVFEDQPFIHNVVFFKSHYGDISPMFSRIGDIAWCYKTVMGVGGTYAPVSKSSFDNFQRAIGCFTPDFFATHTNADVIAIGDTVRILGGIFQSQAGIVKDIEKSGPEGIITYLIAVCTGYAGKVTTNMDSRQVRKIQIGEKA